MTIIEFDDDTMRSIQEREQRLAEQVRIVDDYIVINISYEYNILLTNINTQKDVLGWVFHLAEKTWMTTEVLHRFIQVACSHKNIEYQN